MNTILRQEILSGALNRVKEKSMMGFYNGQGMSDYFMSCQWWVEELECIIIFTKDIGHHTSGWWKNPDYERCWHLSISFPGGRNKKSLEKVINALFGDDKNKIWIEPPYSKTGKQNEVYHYRLFCNEHWEPIIPRGEVYSKEFTEMGWKSYSELQEEKKQ